jgi:uncharacterized membrane protein YukC
MEKEQVLKHNEEKRKEIKTLNDKIDSLKKELKKLRKEIIAPCKWCPYDGVYRCESCQELNYINFNVKDWM